MSKPSTTRAAPSFAALVQSFFTEYLTLSAPTEF